MGWSGWSSCSLQGPSNQSNWWTLHRNQWVSSIQSLILIRKADTVIYQSNFCLMWEMNFLTVFQNYSLSETVMWLTLLLGWGNQSRLLLRPFDCMNFWRAYRWELRMRCWCCLSTATVSPQLTGSCSSNRGESPMLLPLVLPWNSQFL